MVFKVREINNNNVFYFNLGSILLFLRLAVHETYLVTNTGNHFSFDIFSQLLKKAQVISLNIFNVPAIHMEMHAHT